MRGDGFSYLNKSDNKIRGAVDLHKYTAGDWFRECPPGRDSAEVNRNSDGLMQDVGSFFLLCVDDRSDCLFADGQKCKP